MPLWGWIVCGVGGFGLMWLFGWLRLILDGLVFVIESIAGIGDLFDDD